jgi:hypothetical protein
MKTRLSLLSLVLTLFIVPVHGQMSKFKALFLFNFAKNINWPLSSENSTFVITVIGDNDLASELKALSEVRKVGNKDLIINESTTVDQLSESQIIYLGQSKSTLMPMLSSYQKEKPVLLVADSEGLCEQGAGISFVTVDGKLKFQICPSNIEGHGLDLAQKLVYLGIEVQ